MSRCYKYRFKQQLYKYRGHLAWQHSFKRDLVSSQPLKLTSPRKSLPLICQQPRRLNYNRRVCSAHTTGASQLPTLDDRGGCATGPYRTPTTLSHTTKTGSHSSSTYIETNTGKLPKRGDKHGPNERIEQNSRKRAKRNGDKQSIRCRVQNTGYKDAPGT